MHACCILVFANCGQVCETIARLIVKISLHWSQVYYLFLIV